MLLSLGQAARLAGKPKTTIARAIASGRLSAGRNDAGGYAIQVAELERVYPLKSPEQPAQATNGAYRARPKTRWVSLFRCGANSSPT